jgi:hypothetical protein
LYLIAALKLILDKNSPRLGASPARGGEARTGKQRSLSDSTSPRNIDIGADLDKSFFV